MSELTRFLHQHGELTRPSFLKVGGLAVTSSGLLPRLAHADPAADSQPPAKAQLGDGVKKIESLITPQQQFYDVSRGNPLPHTLPEEKKQEVGLTRETWKL